MGVGVDSSGKEDIEAGGDEWVSTSRVVKDGERSSGMGDMEGTGRLTRSLDAEVESKSRL